MQTMDYIDHNMCCVLRGGGQALYLPIIGLWCHFSRRLLLAPITYYDQIQEQDILGGDIWSKNRNR